MNIGIFTDTYFPQINGVATSTYLLKTELEKLGHRVYVFTTSDPHAKTKSPRVFRLPSLPFIFLPTHRMTYLYPTKLLMKIRMMKMDVIHTQTEFSIGLFGKVVSELCRLPLVHTYHTMYEDYVHYVAHGHIITPKMAQNFSRFFCNRARVVIAPVEKTKRSLLEYGVVKPIVVVPTGLDFSNFTKKPDAERIIAETKRELGVSPEDKVIVYVGRIAQEKSLDVVIRAFKDTAAALPNVKMVVVGNGPLADEYKALAESLGIGGRVIFAGPKPWHDIGRYYQIGDLFATASTSETQGLTYLEAIAAGVPVVAKNDESVKGILRHGETGYVFDDDSELPELLRYVLTHQDEAAAVAARGLHFIRPMSAAQFAKNIADVYERVIADAATRKRGNAVFRIIHKRKGPQ